VHARRGEEPEPRGTPPPPQTLLLDFPLGGSALTDMDMDMDMDVCAMCAVCSVGRETRAYGNCTRTPPLRTRQALPTQAHTSIHVSKESRPPSRAPAIPHGSTEKPLSTAQLQHEASLASSPSVLSTTRSTATSNMVDAPAPLERVRAIVPSTARRKHQSGARSPLRAGYR
jgi:hypothetical protein